MDNTETPFHIYLQGKRFEDAALVITEAIRQNPSLAPLTIPVTVNGVLSVELYLKSILLKENGRYQKTHDLVGLFSSLTPESKSKITDRYNREHEHSPAVSKEQVKLIERETGSQIKSDLDSVIADAANTFVQWRYIWQAARGGSSLFLPDFGVALKERVVELGITKKQ